MTEICQKELQIFLDRIILKVCGDSSKILADAFILTNPTEIFCRDQSKGRCELTNQPQFPLVYIEYCKIAEF